MNAPTSNLLAESRSGGLIPMTLGDVVAAVLARKFIFIAVTVLVVAGLVTWAYTTTPIYRVSVKMMPRQAEGANGFQSLLGQFGGLASLAGIGMGASVDEQEAIEWLKSRALAERFIQREKLMPVFFEKAWDSNTGTWRTDLKRTPTIEDAWQTFDRSIRRVDQDTKTKMITLEIAWKDRKRAAGWANGLVQQANDELRGRALREADASVASLQEQLRQTDAVEVRQSIYRLMEVQVNRKVVAKSRADYAFAVVDPAVVPDVERFASPRRRLIVLVSVPLGLFAGIASVLALQILIGLVRGLRNQTARP